MRALDRERPVSPKLPLHSAPPQSPLPPQKPALRSDRSALCHSRSSAVRAWNPTEYALRLDAFCSVFLRLTGLCTSVVTLCIAGLYPTMSGKYPANKNRFLSCHRELTNEGDKDRKGKRSIELKERVGGKRGAGKGKNEGKTQQNKGGGTFPGRKGPWGGRGMVIRAAGHQGAVWSRGPLAWKSPCPRGCWGHPLQWRLSRWDRFYYATCYLRDRTGVELSGD